MCDVRCDVWNHSCDFKRLNIEYLRGLEEVEEYENLWTDGWLHVVQYFYLKVLRPLFFEFFLSWNLS